MPWRNTRKLTLSTTATVARYTSSVETPRAEGSSAVDAAVTPYCSRGHGQVATDLVSERQRELLVMGPHEQPLKREVEGDGDREADRQSGLEGQADDFGKDRRRRQVDERHSAARQRETHPLAEHAGLRFAQRARELPRSTDAG